MDLAYLKEFVYLADTLSFKRTSEHFYVSRSVISRHLAALEESLGASLVDRSNHSVALTEVGQVFYRDAQMLLRDYETAMAHVRVARDAQKRVVHVGYLRNAGRPVIARFARRMKQVHPELHLSLTCMEYGELRRAMDDGTIDVALAVNVDPAVSRNHRSTHLYTDHFSVVMGKDNPLVRKKQGVVLADLPEEKLLLPDSLVYAGMSNLLDGLVEKQMQTMARQYYSDIDILHLKVQTEGYVALTSGLNSALFRDDVAIVPLLDESAEFTVSAFYRDDLNDEVVAALSEAFEFCREKVRDSVAN